MGLAKDLARTSFLEERPDTEKVPSVHPNYVIFLHKYSPVKDEQGSAALSLCSA